MTGCIHSTKCRVASLILAVLLIIVGVAMIFIVQLIEYKEVIANTVLKENSTSLAYGIWKEPKLPIFLQFYVFDLKNPAEVLQGAKPDLLQKGPYTYRVIFITMHLYEFTK